MHNHLASILKEFQVRSTMVSYQELNSGHINDTYLIQMVKKPNYVLQRINGNVFENSLELINNKVLVSSHLQEKYTHLPEEEIHRRVLSFVKAKDNTHYYKDTDGNYWNLTVFIEDSVTYEKNPNVKVAFEAGKATGTFLEFTKDLDLKRLSDILPNFHSITFRYQQFNDAIKKAPLSRLEQAKKWIDFVNSNYQEMQQIDVAIENKKIPLRLTHSDTKISNILFSKEDKALCLIDTDTVMAGAVHFDYGDAIRTICNTTDEDESNEKAIAFNFDFFEAYSKGFFEKLKTSISPEEAALLPLSIKMMPFIMGLRFLTDFLNGNIYYKTSYKDHNFDRAKNQFTLVERIHNQYSEIKTLIKQELSA